MIFLDRAADATDLPNAKKRPLDAGVFVCWDVGSAKAQQSAFTRVFNALCAVPAWKWQACFALPALP
jgi:hypothetical protein